MNLVHHIILHHFLKCGVGYKNYNDDFNGAELNIGFGINAYLTDYVALSIGLDLSNTAFIYHSEWHWNWDSSLLTPKIGLSYNFLIVNTYLQRCVLVFICRTHLFKLKCIMEALYKEVFVNNHFDRIIEGISNIW